MSGRFLVLDEDQYDYPDYDEEPIVKDIDGFPDYEIDSFGGITSYKSGSPRRIKPCVDHGRYAKVVLSDGDGRHHNKLLHRLLAESFIPNPEGYPIVRHYDDDPHNNDLSNLMWGTAKDNADDRSRNERTAHKKVYCYETDTVYSSVKEASEDLGIRPSSISLVCTGRNRSTMGYHLCYAEEMSIKLNDTGSWLAQSNHCKPLTAENLLTGEILNFDSVLEAADYTGLHPASVSAVLRGRRNKAKSWIFY